MKDFVAIDFETANEHSSSICSVGIVLVRDGFVKEKIYDLIKPEPGYYSFWNSRIHGLTAQDTENAKIFPYVWPIIDLKNRKSSACSS